MGFVQGEGGVSPAATAASGTHLVLVLRQHWHCSATSHTIIKASACGFYSLVWVFIFFLSMDISTCLFYHT